MTVEVMNANMYQVHDDDLCVSKPLYEGLLVLVVVLKCDNNTSCKQSLYLIPVALFLQVK